MSPHQNTLLVDLTTDKLLADNEKIKRLIVVSQNMESENSDKNHRQLQFLKKQGIIAEYELLLGETANILKELTYFERFDRIHSNYQTFVKNNASFFQLLLPNGQICLLSENTPDDIPLVDGFYISTENGHRIIKNKISQPLQNFSNNLSCAVCKGHLKFHDEHSQFSIFLCKECGLVQLSLHDQKSQKKWLDFYDQNGKYHKDRQLCGYTSFTHRYLHDLNLARIRMENLVRFRKTGRFLDIGCSNGALVKMASDYGFMAEGIDVDSWVVAKAKETTGCIFYAACPLEFTPPHLYDVITIIDTFEHFYDPNLYLEKIRSFLCEEGLMVVEMPDASEPGFSRLGTEWKHFKPKEHAFYFGKEHFAKLLADKGFDLADSIVPYPDRRIYYAVKKTKEKIITNVASFVHHSKHLNGLSILTIAN